MSEDSTDQAAPLQFLRKPQSKISWKIFSRYTKGKKVTGKNQFTKLNMKKSVPLQWSLNVSWIASARAWPEQQQDYCTCWTRAGIPCLALIHQLRETLASWRWSKGGPPTWAECCRTCSGWRNWVCSAQRKSNSNIPTPKRCSERRWKQKQAQADPRKFHQEIKSRNTESQNPGMAGVGRELVSFQCPATGKDTFQRPGLNTGIAHPENCSNNPHWRYSKLSFGRSQITQLNAQINSRGPIQPTLSFNPLLFPSLWPSSPKGQPEILSKLRTAWSMDRLIIPCGMWLVPPNPWKKFFFSPLHLSCQCYIHKEATLPQEILCQVQPQTSLTWGWGIFLKWQKKLSKWNI